MEIKKQLEGCSIDQLYTIMKFLEMGSYDAENKTDLIDLILAWHDRSNIKKALEKLHA